MHILKPKNAVKNKLAFNIIMKKISEVGKKIVPHKKAAITMDITKMIAEMNHFTFSIGWNNDINIKIISKNSNPPPKVAVIANKKGNGAKFNNKISNQTNMKETIINVYKGFLNSSLRPVINDILYSFDNY